MDANKGALENTKEELEKLQKLDKELKEKVEKLEQRYGSASSSKLDTHMDALHAYNDIKDLAQMVMGTLADLQKVTVAELHDKYNLPKDE